MQPLRIRIDRIVDFGTVVSLVGFDVAAAIPVTVHIDHRPFAAFWQAWWEAGLPQPVEYEADRLLLHLDMLPDEHADEVRLIEPDGVGAIPADDKHAPAAEVER